MNDLLYNLSHGTLAVVVPELYQEFRENVFTSKDVINLQYKYCTLSTLKKMHSIGYIEPVIVGDIKIDRPTRWRFRKTIIPIIEQRTRVGCAVGD
jgi:hypothetical protein